MPRIQVLVVTPSKDIKAEVICDSVARRSDMVLAGGRPVAPREADALIETLPLDARSAVILIGGPAETAELPARWLDMRAGLVVMSLDIVGDMVRIEMRDPRLESLLNALRGLVERVGVEGQARVVRIQLPDARATEHEAAVPSVAPPDRPLLGAAVDWIHRTLRDAILRVPDDNGDVHGLSLTRATLLQSLDAPATTPIEADDPTNPDSALDRALSSDDVRHDPLARAWHVFDLSGLEFRLLLLGLAPELDVRYQRCIGFLLDEIGRRTGTLPLYASLLGSSVDIRMNLAAGGALDRWRVFEGGLQAAADEPLKLDPFLARWLLGDRTALTQDPRVRRVLRLIPWPGASLVARRDDRARGERVVAHLIDPAITSWLALDGPDPEAWRALIEHGAIAHGAAPIRVDFSSVPAGDVVDAEDCARRIGRLARLSGDPLIVDAVATPSEDRDYGQRLFFETLAGTGAAAAALSSDEARIVRLLGSTPFDLVHDEALPPPGRTAAMRAAAEAADAYLTEDSARSLAQSYALRLDRLEHAASLARSRPLDYGSGDARAERFVAAVKSIAAEGLSHLADLIEPVFELESVVLPPDRKQQLLEIVDNVRLAPRVLEGWKFGDQLPYGRSVTVLMSGPSGVGKTMSCIAIARRLGVQLLRLDLSKVVSKYIGDTEKNIDRVFTDGERSGAAILIDEADAILGRRSEVKDAHDRYANIEISYLLQRMEGYTGALAMFTTNMRQALEPALLRRLRFIVEFPRPDAEAREQIWRLCLPADSHVLDDAAFRQLARRVDVTGGHIRQITLRAAFLAAAAGTRIGLDHIAQAARAELAKLGMPAVDLDLSTGRQAA